MRRLAAGCGTCLMAPWDALREARRSQKVRGAAEKVSFADTLEFDYSIPAAAQKVLYNSFRMVPPKANEPPSWYCPMIVFEYLYRIAARKQSLESQFAKEMDSDPHNASKSDSAQQLIVWEQQFRDESSIAEQISRNIRSIADAEAMRADDGEKEGEMTALIDDEVSTAVSSVRDSAPDIDNVIDRRISMADVLNTTRKWTLEVQGKAGGVEAGLFAVEILELMKRYCDFREWRWEDITEQGAASGGTIRIDGDDVYHNLRHEIGIHRVQRVPVTDAAGKLQTSTAAVFLMPMPNPVDLDIKESDCELSFARGSGPGGQGMQSSSNCCSLFHKPSGIAFKVHSARSAQMNKELAMEKLAQLLWKEKMLSVKKNEGSLLASQWTSGERSEKIRTYNFPQNRVTEHRLGRDYACVKFMESGSDMAEIHSAMNLASRKSEIEKALVDRIQQFLPRA